MINLFRKLEYSSKKSVIKRRNNRNDSDKIEWFWDGLLIFKNRCTFAKPAAYFRVLFSCVRVVIKANTDYPLRVLS
ncbi:hypothetical protein LEP1GSC036_0593 [Leptospira weilii str. 2006001853]|uniref:Uncharacterized protein n=1 Tax=Leptospira weilii str. 2006001853 TaxID=1001589 RepID=A0A828YYY3_9LEPT|nr:hypothetical protein LEP1GSC036_0593 [Leptospira weilii str. 2006001853]EMN42793.1 hypothetical protein LEP1GSC086_1778 [Leptospira weilii str. LNT 1234]